MELFLEPVTRLRARKMKEHDDSITNGLLAFLEEAMKGGLKCKTESLEDSCKYLKLLMIHTLNKEKQM